MTSPSYTLINVYKAKFLIFHMDLYRLESKNDIDDLGWEDNLGQGILVVEWAEKMDYPGETIRVTFEVRENQQRRITIRIP